MDTMSTTQRSAHLARQICNLKLISRLLGHELHAQSSSKSIQLSKEEVAEIRTTIDLFIEEVSRQQGSKGTSYASVGAAPEAPITSETALITARNN